MLLILAGITISLTVGQRGILTRAEEAGKNYQESAQKEDEDLSKILEEADNIIAGTGGNTIQKEPENLWEEDPDDAGWSKQSSETKKDNYVDALGKKATIPAGFKVSKKNGETKINEGLVIKDATTNNEFVWVPCTEDGKDGSIQYDRYAFSRAGWSYTQTKDENGVIRMTANNVEYSFTEVMPTDEINSIKQYRGFYIGRYEVGVEEGKQDLSDMKDEWTAPNTQWTGWKEGMAVVQADKQPWNYITRDMAKEMAEGMYRYHEEVTSKLCSSYAWDTTLIFIETNHTGYATNGTTDIPEELRNTAKGGAPVNNIYDMGGNVAEWTTEACGNVENPCTDRGGVYHTKSNEVPAGTRGHGLWNSAAIIDGGFRPALYVKP